MAGKKQFGAGGSTNVRTALKMNHLQNLATWAGGEASIPSLAAFFGTRLASCGEVTGTPLDQSLISCDRCETILQPGYNCFVRIEKKRGKVQRHNKSSKTTQNDVIYTCQFCSNRNRRKGTPKGHVKELLASTQKSTAEPKSIFPTKQKSVDSKIALEICQKVDEKMEELTPLKNAESSPATPAEKVQPLLLERKKRKKSGSRSNTKVGTENETTIMDMEKVTASSSKKRKRSGTSLKKIAEENELKNKSAIANLKIPFFI